MRLAAIREVISVIFSVVGAELMIIVDPEVFMTFNYLFLLKI